MEMLLDFILPFAAYSALPCAPKVTFTRRGAGGMPVAPK
jgi:hypothetical protein